MNKHVSATQPTIVTIYWDNDPSLGEGWIYSVEWKRDGNIVHKETGYLDSAERHGPWVDAAHLEALAREELKRWGVTDRTQLEIKRRRRW
jgi:hypothetical protein